MSEVVLVRQAHQLTAEGVKARLVPFEKDIERYGMKLRWEGTSGVLTGPGVSGEVQISDTEAVLSVTLGRLVQLAGAKPELVRERLSRRLAAVLSE